MEDRREQGPKSMGGNPLDRGRRCEAKTSRGSLCKNDAAVGSHFCPHHDPKLKIRTRWDQVTGR